MEQYGCSRMTVNKALSALSSARLIDRRKRAGTFVARPQVHSMVLDVPDLAQQVRGRGQDYAFVLIHRAERPPKWDAPGEAALAGGGALLQIEGVHLADGIPLAVETRLVSLEAVPAMREADLSQTAPGSWLLQHIPWTEAETRISAIAATEHDAKRLQAPVGTACLCLKRMTWRGSEQITHVRQIFPAEVYELVARFGSDRSNILP